MLCIIFTKRKILAGAYFNTVFLYPLDNPVTILANESVLATFQRNLVNFRSLLQEKGKNASSGFSKPIPVSLVFSLGYEAETRNQILEWLKQQPNEYRLIHLSNPASAYLYKQFPASKQLVGGCAVLEGFDDVVHLSYHYHKDGRAVEQYLPLPELGWKSGRNRVWSYLIAKLRENGLVLKKEGKQGLWRSLMQYKNNQPLKVKQHSQEVEINVVLRLEPKKYGSLLLSGRDEIKKHFSRKNMKHFNIYNVFFMGNYFSNSVLKHYFKKEATLNRLTIREILDDSQALKAVAEGALLKTAHLLDAEKRVRLKARLSQLNSRDRLFEEINDVCIDGNKVEVYKSNFIPRAKRLGIPPDVVLWHIEDKLQKVSVTKKMTALDAAPLFVKSERTTALKKDDLPSVGDDGPNADSITAGSKGLPNQVSKTFSLPHVKSDSESMAQAGQASRENKLKAELSSVHRMVRGSAENALFSSVSQPDGAENFPILFSYFSLEKEYPDSPFLYFKGRLRGDKASKVIRFISSEVLEYEQQAEIFRRLYEWESGYYDNISTIYTTSEGKYYYRDYIKGQKLADYIRAKGIDKKRSITEFTSEDLQLLRLVFGEINGLNFACKNFNQDNFIITMKLKWTLRRELGVKIINFPYEEGTPDQMYASVHTTLATLLRENVYSELIEKFRF